MEGTPVAPKGKLRLPKPWITKQRKGYDNPEATADHTYPFRADDYLLADLKKRFVAKGVKDADGKRRTLSSLVDPNRMTAARESRHATTPNRAQVVAALIASGQEFSQVPYAPPGPKRPRRPRARPEPGLQTWDHYLKRLKPNKFPGKRIGWKLRSEEEAIAANLPNDYYRMAKQMASQAVKAQEVADIKALEAIGAQNRADDLLDAAGAAVEAADAAAAAEEPVPVSDVAAEYDEDI